MLSKFLVVEDEPGLVEFLRLELELEGNEVVVAYTGEEALLHAEQQLFDAALLDVMLPDMSGLEVCRAIRANSEAIIVMLTARGSISDRVTGLDAGADDYLVKPFAIEELMARLRALTRRGPKKVQEGQGDSTITYGNIVVNLERHRVWCRGFVVDLTVREYELLVHLMRHPDHVFSRNDLLHDVWGFESPVDTNVVDVYVGYLRQKVDRDKTHIQTVRGLGYVFRTIDI